MAKLFEYAVIFHAKQTRDVQGNETTQPDVLVVDLTTVLANTDRQVGMIAAKQIPDEYESQLEQIEIIIRPF